MRMTARVYCSFSAVLLCLSACLSTTDAEVVGRPKTQCEQHRYSLQSRNGGVPLVGSFIPECDEEGQYRPQQCHGSTGYCWCVDSRGQERAGTQTPPGTPIRNCDEPGRPKTQCEQHRYSLQSRNGGVPLVGSYIPECDEEGQYRPQQCHGSTGYCWCVDSRGQERAGTRTPPGTPRRNCDKPVSGQCPAMLTVVPSRRGCTSDRCCSGGHKCCQFPCGSACVPPVFTKPKPPVKPASEQPKPPLPANSPSIQ